MSRHNRERRQFRRLAKDGADLTAYQRTRLSRHGKRKLRNASTA